jgi:hypothetical protein
MYYKDVNAVYSQNHKTQITHVGKEEIMVVKVSVHLMATWL